MRLLLGALGFGVGDRLGGSVRVAAANARALAARGHEVEFWCTNLIDKDRHISEGASVATDHGVTVHYWPTRSIPRWPGALGPHWVSVSKAARERVGHFDIVHIHEFRSFLAGRMTHWAANDGVPFVVQPQGTFARHSDRRIVKTLYDGMAGRRIREQAAAFVAATRAEAAVMRAAGIPEERITVVPNGIDLHAAGPLPERGTFRKRFGIGDDIPLIVSVGRVDEVKGFDLMLRGMQHVPAPTMYAVVGPEYGMSDKLRAIAGELKLESRFLLTGALPDARDVMSAIVDCDVFVLPSRHDAFGQVVLEACLASKPMVLSSGVNSAADFADRAALVVPPDPAALAQATNRLLANEPLRVRFGQEARRLLDREYRIEVVAEKLERVYEQALNALDPRRAQG